MARHARTVHRPKPTIRSARPSYRVSLSIPAAPASFTATVAKKEFGRLLEIVLRGGRVVITKHDAPKAVVLSMDEFNALTGATERTLETLRGHFDAVLAGMQTPRTRAGMQAAFEASPRDVGRAAVAAARKRG